MSHRTQPHGFFSFPSLSHITFSFVYELALVCDRGAEPEKWTSYKLKHAVLYLETLTERYELSCEERPPGCSAAYDTYRWAKVLKPYETDRAALEKVRFSPPFHWTILFSLEFAMVSFLKFRCSR